MSKPSSNQNLNISNQIKLEFLNKFFQFLNLSDEQLRLNPSQSATGVDLRQFLLNQLESSKTSPQPTPNDAQTHLSVDRLQQQLASAKHQVQQLKVELAQRNQKAAINPHQKQLQDQIHQLKIQNQSLITIGNQKTKQLIDLKQQIIDQQAEIEQIQTQTSHNQARWNQKMVEIGQFDPETAKANWIKTNQVVWENELKRQFNQLRNHWSNQLNTLAQQELLVAMERNAPLVAKNRTLLTIEINKLPTKENLKSRIIGRSGKNIQSFEQATGVELIINKGKSIGISSFNPLKRQVAYNALLELIRQDKFSPSWIKKVVEKCQSEIEEEIVQIGRTTIEQLKLKIEHPRLLYLIGKLKFRSGYGQQVLKHSIEVAHFAGQIAAQLGLDVTTARRAGLLHDIGKAVDRDQVGNHVEIGVQIAQECGESPTIINAIHAHHGAVSPTTPYGNIVKIADTLSAARFGARLNSKEDFVSRINALEKVIKDNFSGLKAVHIYKAGREINILVDAEKIDDQQACRLSGQIFQKVSDEVKVKGRIVIPGDINITILRTKMFQKTVRS